MLPTDTRPYSLPYYFAPVEGSGGEFGHMGHAIKDMEDEDRYGNWRKKQCGEPKGTRPRPRMRSQ